MNEIHHHFGNTRNFLYFALLCACAGVIWGTTIARVVIAIQNVL